MRFQTIIERKETLNQKSNKVFMILKHTIEIIINTFIPFTIGFYFGTSQKIYWVFAFIFIIIFSVRIDLEDGNKVKIKIIRSF